MKTALLVLTVSGIVFSANDTFAGYQGGGILGMMFLL